MDDQNQDYNLINQINRSKLLNNELLYKQKQQNLEIEEKMKLLNTRNRMLQLSYEENLYKKKILYILLSILLLIIVFGVIFMLKKK